jgi:hypothetical protein
MVVLSSSICTRGGKALLSRQFRDLNKDKITALLANFPSLISNSGQQNTTTVEDEHVRYVYQPLEEFYIVLLTLKDSNIMQDIDTLHLFAATISNMLRTIDEREIFDKAFEILSSFDEIITLGYKENLTLLQVQTFLEMDSHEEKIQEIIERNKEMEAGEERKRRAKEIQRKELARKAMERSQIDNTFAGAGAGNYGNSGLGAAGGYGLQLTPIDLPSYQTNSNYTETAPPSNQHRHVPTRGGLQLGKKGGRGGAPLTVLPESNQPLLTQAQPHFNHPQVQQPQTREHPSLYQPQVPTLSLDRALPSPSLPKVANNGILITVSERCTAEITREGSVIKSEVKGDLKLRINNLDYSRAKILLKTGGGGSVQFKARPEVDFKAFNASSVITLKDPSKAFPSNDQSLGVLRWRCVGKEDDTTLLPVVITAWVNVDDTGLADVTLEYEVTADYIESHPAQQSLSNIKVLVPIVSHDVEIENDNVSFDVTEEGVVFDIETISFDEPSGSFQFQIPAADEDSLFPMELHFDINRTGLDDSERSFGQVQVIDVVNAAHEDEESLPFDLHSQITSDNYQIV